jgi:hypothetical protein
MSDEAGNWLTLITYSVVLAYALGRWLSSS